jgi:predicted ATPase
MISSQYIRSIRLNKEKVSNFKQYPFNLPAVKALSNLEFHPKVTFIVGENGSGKSTLLEAIAVQLGFNAEGGTKNFSFSTKSSHSELHDFVTAIKGFKTPNDGFFLRAESFYNVATAIDNYNVTESYGSKSLHEQSHGESFLALMMHRFGGKGIYILDEPEAALSPQRQFAVLTRIHDLVLDDSQFIIATHSPILMAYPDAWIYHCSERGISRIAYKDTEHYQITRDFLLNPERMLEILLRVD